MEGVESSLLPTKEIVEGKILPLFFSCFCILDFWPIFWQVHKENKIVAWLQKCNQWMALSFEGLNSTHLSRVTCVYDWKYAIEHFVVLRQNFFCGFKRHEILPDWSFCLFFSAIVKVVRALGNLYNWTWLARFENLWHFPTDIFYFWINCKIARHFDLLV